MKGIVFVALALFSAGASPAQIREIPVPQLNDIAMASIDAQGPVIYYNPGLCQRVGPLICEFFRAHEYGHHARGHIYREMFNANPYNRAWVRQEYEKEADCWAAANAPIQSSRAAMVYFARMQGPYRPDWYHPTGYQRADVISRCMPGW